MHPRRAVHTPDRHAGAGSVAPAWPSGVRRPPGTAPRASVWPARDRGARGGFVPSRGRCRASRAWRRRGLHRVGGGRESRPGRSAPLPHHGGRRAPASTAAAGNGAPCHRLRRTPAAPARVRGRRRGTRATPGCGRPWDAGGLVRAAARCRAGQRIGRAEGPGGRRPGAEGRRSPVHPRFHGGLGRCTRRLRRVERPVGTGGPAVHLGAPGDGTSGGAERA